jgi:hypothetical protein
MYRATIELEFNQKPTETDVVHYLLELISNDSLGIEIKKRTNPNSVGYYGYNQKTDNYFKDIDD